MSPLAPLFAQVRQALLLLSREEGKLGSPFLETTEPWASPAAIAALSSIERHLQDMETALGAARLVADMHESGEGFQWVGTEDDTEALDALCRALAALPATAGQKGEGT